MMYYCFFVFFLLFNNFCMAFDLSKEDSKKIGMQIWMNECSGKKEGLTSWNIGEEFASMGIGHFIWYPQNNPRQFEEQFPKLLTFLEEQNIVLPKWLNVHKFCPWNSREEFQKELYSKKLEELRSLLLKTIDIQVQFIVSNLEKSLNKMIDSTSESKKKHLRFQINRLMSSPNGIYALIDYRNFKGDGSCLDENYCGARWGLLQVLEKMPHPSNEDDAIKEFITAAKGLLLQRVKNAPQEREEERWLKGWFNRLETYNKKLLKICNIL